MKHKIIAIKITAADIKVSFRSLRHLLNNALREIYPVIEKLDNKTHSHQKNKKLALALCDRDLKYIKQTTEIMINELSSFEKTLGNRYIETTNQNRANNVKSTRTSDAIYRDRQTFLTKYDDLSRELYYLIDEFDKVLDDPDINITESLFESYDQIKELLTFLYESLKL